MQSTSACGHLSPGKEGFCYNFCDDFVETLEGACYLKAFSNEIREDIYNKLGSYPEVVVFMTEFWRRGADQTYSTSITAPLDIYSCLHCSSEEIPQQECTVIGSGECNNCKKLFYIYGTTLRPAHDQQCQFCKADFVNVTYMIRTKYYNNKIGSLEDLPIGNLIKQEPIAVEYELRRPELYRSSAPMPILNTSVSVDEEEVTVRIGTHVLKAQKYEQKLSALVHDFVYSRWTESTDVKLSSIGVKGPEGGLTPDYIIPGTKCVLELGTCNTDSYKSLERMFTDKAVKYQGELQLTGAKFFIIIVSPQNVMTNANISQEYVDELTIRMRLATPIKQQVSDLLGEDIFQSDLSEYEKLAKLEFESVPNCVLNSDKYKFKLSEIKECATPITSLEAKSVKTILLKELKGTEKTHSSKISDLEDYMNQFNNENSRMDNKRICNVPLMLPGYGKVEMRTDFDELDLDKSLKRVWEQVCSKSIRTAGVTSKLSLQDILENKEREDKHFTKRSQLKKLILNEEDKSELALSGVGGKAFVDHDEVKEHRGMSKLSFHPLTNTDDIEEFSKEDLLTIDQFSTNRFVPYSLERVVELSKTISTGSSNNLSVKIWKKILSTDFMKYCMMMSNVFTELSYCYKHWTQHYEFLHKKLDCGVEMIIYNPKSTLFVSFAFPIVGCKVWDKGRLGPRMYKSSTHYFTDWSSFDNSQLEHFIKFGPYMGACLIDLMNSSSENFERFSDYTRECIPHLLMLYCNNKTDVEELVTSQRYLFMKLLEDVKTSPYIFVSRFPKVLRSRLTCFYLKRTIDLMKFYDQTRIVKIPSQGPELKLYEYLNIKSLFSRGFISLSMKINEFYYGYVVSKERNTGKDKTFKVLTKLIKQEQRFRENVHGSMFTRDDKYEEFKTNMPMIKFFSRGLSELLEHKFGKDYKQKILKDYYHAAARSSFGELATLKVSSRDHSKEIDLKVGDESTEKIYEQLKEDFPQELFKRPFCMESLTQIIKEYEEDTGKKITHVVQLARWSLDKLVEKGYFDSDQFDKSQHGGEREIHVLEMKARIVQYYLEMVARVICSYFPSETTMNPETKDKFVSDHYKQNNVMFKDDCYTISKSADASTWCQYHHSTHFAAMYSCFLPPELENFVYGALSLWPRKRLSFPMKQMASLAANLNLQTSNKVYMQFKTEFQTGTGMFTKPMTNKIEVMSGMFQGLLHTTSSLYHTMIQEVMKLVMEKYITVNLKCIPNITICQGSDDSSCMLTLPGKPTAKKLFTAKRLLLWKERISPYLSVLCNEAKSSIGTHDLVEYNSEWHIRHMIVKPTFRWVSASMELSVTERFIDRLRIFYNMISECLSGGASTLECSVIQLFQATLHYTLLGAAYSREDLAVEYVSRITQQPEPIFGFFPMDDDISCGVPGLEFLLYNLFEKTTFGTLQNTLAGTDIEADYSPEDVPNWMKTKDLSSVRLKFSNMKVFYRVVERMNLEPLEYALRAIESDPSIVFSSMNSWSDEQHNLVLKVFSKGVKESISRKCSTLRMSASSAYILTTKCFIDNNIRDKEKDNKFTLLSLMERSRLKIMDDQKLKDAKKVFPFFNEFRKLRAEIDDLKDNSTLVSQSVKRTSKAKLVVIEKPIDEVDPIELCKRVWYGKGNVPFSRGQTARKWNELRIRLPFLDGSNGDEGILKTAKNLNMSVVQTKMFLESLSTRSRSIVLYDTTSKGTSLKYSLSRIFWPGEKLLTITTASDALTKLRSELFSVLTYWFSKKQKENLVKSIIKISDCLKPDWQLIPKSFHSLKIMSEVLRGTSNEDLFGRLEASKKGLLGVFTQVQSGLGANRKGEGIWQGSVCGISTSIHMKENVCYKIVVQNLYDTVSLGYLLNQFMNEANLTMPSKEDVSKYQLKSNCWLSANGRIVQTNKMSGVPILHNPKLKVTRMDDLKSAPWYVDILRQNIRLRARDPRTGKMLTILSERMTSRDWIPGSSTDLGDPCFYRWQSGNSCNLPLVTKLFEEIIPSNRHDFVKFIKDLETKPTNNKLNWDMKELQLTLRDLFLYKVKNNEESKEVEDEEKKMGEKFQDMLKNLSIDFDEGIEEEIEMWAEEMEEEEEFGSLAQEEFWDEEAIQESINLFLGNSQEKFYDLVDVVDKSKNYRMPSVGRFFSPIEHLTQIKHNCSFRELLQSRKSSEGILGLICSLVNAVFLMGTDDGTTNELIAVEDAISTSSVSMTDPAFLRQMDLDELRISISNTQNQLQYASGSLKRRLTRLLNIYLSQEESILSTNEKRSEDIIAQHSEEVFDNMIDFMSSRGKFSVDISTLDSIMKRNLAQTMIRTEVSRSNEITEQEKEEVIYNMANSKLSLSAVQAISVVYKFNVKLNEDFVMRNIEDFNMEQVLDISVL